MDAEPLPHGLCGTAAPGLGLDRVEVPAYALILVRLNIFRVKWYMWILPGQHYDFSGKHLQV